MRTPAFAIHRHPIFAAISTLMISFALLGGHADGDDPSTQPAAAPSPSPQMQPQEVIRAVVDALGRNDQNDNGIRLAWKFASPENQQATGPIERFIPMVKSPTFAPLLNFQSVKYGPLQQKDDQAIQAVAIQAADGSMHYYAFVLGREAAGPLKDCWLTNGVIPLHPPSAPPAQQRPNPPSGDTPA